MARVSLGSASRAAVRLPLARLALHELVEVALLAPGGLLLHEERELGGLELLEEVVPRDVLERALAAVLREVDPDDPDVVPLVRALHRRGLAAPLFCPCPDLLVIGRPHGCAR